MTDRQILFFAPMVHALLDGRKTQTRRVIKPRGKFSLFDGTWSDSYVLDVGNAEWRAKDIPVSVGDRIWVRETWQGLTFGDFRPTKYQPCEVRYYATDPCANLDADARGYQWRPSIFMPRWASRLTLTVTDVRVERLQDISEEDAVGEGCFKGKASGRVFSNEAAMHLGGDEWSNARDWYADLWDQINKPGAWDSKGLSGISCKGVHNGSKGDHPWHDGKSRLYRTQYWTNCWQAGMRNLRLTAAGLSTS